MALPELIANSSTIGSDAALTTLAGNGGSIAANANSMKVAAAAPSALQASAGQFRTIIDHEIILIDAATASGITWSILQRGLENTTPALHNDGAQVWHKPTAGMLESRYARVSQLALGNGVDDTAAINAVLASGGRVRGNPGTLYKISSPLIIPSNCEFDMTGCTIQYASGIVAVFNMLQNSKVAPAVTATDVTTTAGSSVITSPTLAASAQQGQMIAVVAAGPPGGNAAQSFSAGNIWLYGSVQSVTGNNITLTSTNKNGIAAHTSLANATGYLFNRDSNVSIIGGIWDGGTAYAIGGDINATPSRNANWTSFNSHQLRLRRVDGLTIRGIATKLTNFPGGGGWVNGINPGDCTDFLIENIEGNGSSTTVEGDGPLARGDIRDVRGTTQDDMVSFGPVAFQGNDLEGDIIDILVDGVQSNNSWRGVDVWGGLGSNGAQRLMRCAVKSVKGTSQHEGVRAIDYAGVTAGPINMAADDITIVPAAGNQAILNSAAQGQVRRPPQIYHPSDSGLLAVTDDPLRASSTVQPTAGFIYIAAIKVPNPIAVTNLLMAVSVAGATLTAGQNTACLYDPLGLMGPPGGIIATVPDQATTWNSVSQKTMALTARTGYSLNLPGGHGVFYWVGVIVAGTTRPSFAGTPSASAGLSVQSGFGGPYVASPPTARHRVGYESAGARTALISLNGLSITDNNLRQMFWAGLT